jgi:hypothetical protein
MTRRTIVPLLVAAFALVALPAHAAPWQQSWLPDADLFCVDEGAGWVDVGPWVGNPDAASLWVAAGPFAGHYVLVEADHYLEFGVAAVAPRDAFDGTVYLYSTTFGEKRGLTDRVDCQVVSRFAGPLTVYAPMKLARIR